MEFIDEMLSITSKPAHGQQDLLVSCVEACLTCELVCVACADACLAEREVQALHRSITANLECAEVCASTARLLARRLEPNVELLLVQLEACVRACAACIAACGRHAEVHDHCRICVSANQRCATLCRRLIRELASNA